MTCEVTHPLVCVKWVDAEQTSGWSEDDPSDDEDIMYTYGLLVRKNNRFVVLADTHLSANNEWGGLNKIPYGSVVEIDVLLDEAPCSSTTT